MKKVRGRLLLLLLVVVISVFCFLPSFPDVHQALPAWTKSFLPNKGISLGLDLQGGIHLVMEVDEDRAVEIAVDRSVVALQDLLVEKKIPVESVKRTSPTRITIQFQNADVKPQVQKLLDDFPSFTEVESDGSANSFVWDLREAESKRIKDSAINQALETIRNRIDQFGVAEPLVQRQGLKQIVVQLPGVRDPKRDKDLIKETALLEFKMLDEDNQMKLDLPARIPKDREAEVVKQAENKVPEGSQILFERAVERDTGREYRIPYLVKKRVMLTGDVLSDARVAIGQFNDPYVSITFDAKGGREFERITGENVKKRMAIVLDNTIYSAPVIQERIGGGRAQITGTFTTQEANDLAIVLRAGALPAPVAILEERTVGPSLGADSIRQGIIAILGSGVVVFVF
ncbi:MAG TPA: protein translocase subunit SecD, partial [Nitrospiraceae bacterium]|nr:protein translocase subunit SecD [Nitrospiraceae bacterium]